MSRALIADIIVHAAHLSGYSPETILSSARHKPIVRVRHAIMLIAREQKRWADEQWVNAYSLPQIARALDRFDHSTVINGLKKAKRAIKDEPGYAAFVGALRIAARTGRAKPYTGPVILAEPAKRTRKPHIKAITLLPGEEADEGHRFHAGIAMGSAALLKALAA